MGIKFTLRQAVKAVGGKYIGSKEALDGGISSVVIDSRQAGDGALFVAIKGENTDGHNYIESAKAKGAVCCIAEKKTDSSCPCILVEDSVKALQALARWYRRSLKAKVVGITGSVGKTTCKEIVASVLGVKYNVLKTQGNFNNEIGLPLTILSMTEETEIAVIEMGMSVFGEMSLLSGIAKPDMCVITNIGHSHMENLGSQEGIFRAKCEIFESMAVTAPAFLNGDDKFLRRIRRKNAVFFGFGEENDIRAENAVDKGAEGTSCDANAFGRAFGLSVPIPGRHVLYAALAAAGVGLSFGLTYEEILRGIENASTVDGRVNIIRRGETAIIDDCYNAAPASMKAGLDLLSSFSGERVAVLGDMGELGPAAAELHREVGAYAAEKNIGLLAAAGELSKNICAAFAEKGGKALWFETKAELMEKLYKIVPKKGAVLVKASHFMGFDEVVRACEKYIL